MHVCKLAHILVCAQLTAQQVQEAKNDDQIAIVSADTTVSTSEVQVQSDAPWDLDRIDQPNLPLDGLYHYSLDGSNINVYILDTVCGSNIL